MAWSRRAKASPGREDENDLSTKSFPIYLPVAVLVFAAFYVQIHVPDIDSYELADVWMTREDPEAVEFYKKCKDKGGWHRARDDSECASSILRFGKFSSAHVGVVGSPSLEVVAFQSLLQLARDPDSAFKALLDAANPAARLYALCGIYWTDPARFAIEVEKVRRSEEPVRVVLGCVESVRSMSQIVERPGALRLERGQTLREWHKANPLAEFPPVDIIGGGWPEEFRSAFEAN